MESSYLTNVLKQKLRQSFDDWALAVDNLMVLERMDKYLREKWDIIAFFVRKFEIFAKN